jgi:hypothetical protein
VIAEADSFTFGPFIDTFVEKSASATHLLQRVCMFSFIYGFKTGLLKVCWLVFCIFLLSSGSAWAQTAYYLNDDLDTNDVYTTAAGNDANSGTNSAAPMRTLTNLLAVHTLGPGDVVYIDSGVYAHGTVTLNASGASDAPIVFQGVPVQGGALFDLTGTGSDGFLLGSRTHLVFRDLTVQGARDGFVSTGPSVIDFERVVVRNSSRYGIRSDSGLSAAAGLKSFSRCLFVENGAAAIAVSRSTMSLDGCVFWENGKGVDFSLVNGVFVNLSVVNSVFVGGQAFAGRLNLAGTGLFGGSPKISGDYNVFWDTRLWPSGYNKNDGIYHTIGYLQELEMPNSTYAEPGFVNPEALDFRPATNSVLIDFGDPAVGSYTNEPGGPENMRINAGLYGGTAEATVSPTNDWLLAVSYNDGGYLTGVGNALVWNYGGGLGGADTVTLQWSGDLGHQWSNIIVGLSVTNRVYDWDVSGLAPTSLIWRVVSDANTNIWSSSRQRVSVNGSRVPFYVNDVLGSNDVYTSAAGSPGADGLTPATPLSDLGDLLDRYAFGGFEVVYIDGGAYTGTVSILEDVTPSTQLLIQGHPNAGETVFHAASDGDNVVDVRSSNLRLQGLTLVDGRDGVQFYDYVGDLGNVTLSELVIRDASRYGVARLNEATGTVRIENSVIDDAATALYWRFGRLEVNRSLLVSNTVAFNSVNYSTTHSLSNSIVIGGALTASILPDAADHLLLWDVDLPGAANLDALQRQTGKLLNSAVLDPQLVASSDGFYYPRSPGGRYDPATGDFVVTDTNYSPAIDFGDPADPVGLESVPNGLRANVGALGGTERASRSRPDGERWLQVMSLTDGGVLNFGEAFTDTVRWNSGGFLSNDTVRIELSLNSGDDWQVIATNIAALAGAYIWTNASPNSSFNARWRVVYEDDDAVKSATQVNFEFKNGPYIYYVNDTVRTGDIYTGAIGELGNDGSSSNSPLPSIKAVADRYGLQPGDIIYVDTGTYPLTATETLSGGGPEDFIYVYGSTNRAAGGTVFDRGSASTTTVGLNFENTGRWALDHIRVVRGGTGIRIHNTPGMRLRHVETDDTSLDGVRISGASTNVVIERSVFRRSRGDGLQVESGASVALSHGVLWDNRDAGLRASGGATTVDHTVVGARGDRAFGYWAAGTQSITGNYNAFHTASNGVMGFIRDAPWNRTFTTAAAWSSATGNELHSLSADPLFLDAADGRFQLGAGSLLIDAGDPALSAASEPGGGDVRINIGLYGGTPEAAVRSGAGALYAARPRDGGWLAGTGSLKWVAYGAATGDTVAVEYTLDGGQTWVELTNGVPAMQELIAWDVSGLTDTPAARWRVTSSSDSSDSGSFFALRNGGGLSFYVNDAVDAGDQYTTAAGAATNWMASTNAPLSDLAQVLALYDLEPGDHVFVDNGRYVGTTSRVIDRRHSGGEDERLRISGSTNLWAGGTVLDLSGSGAGDAGLQLSAADWLSVSDLQIESAGVGLRIDGGEGHRFADMRFVRNQSQGVTVSGGTDIQLLRSLSAENTAQGYAGSSGADVRWRNGVIWSNGSHAISQSSGSLSVFNSVIAAFGLGVDALDLSASVSVTSDYNNWWIRDGARVAQVANAVYGSLIDWVLATDNDRRSLSHDPLFADAAGLDFHLQSPRGRFDVISNAYVQSDMVYSPLIDAGEPGLLATYSAEPVPNGGRVNIGLHGNSDQASLSDTNGWLRVLTVNDGGTIRGEQTFYWSAGGPVTNGTVTLEFSEDGGATWMAVETNAPALAADGFTYDTTLLGTWPTARWRVRSNLAGYTNIVNQTDNEFLINNGPLTFYVNDDDRAGDIYTTAVGDPLANGVTSNTPVDRIQTIIERYGLREGDTILVDAGTYALDLAVVLNDQQLGASTNPIVIQGSTDPTAPTILQRAGSQAAIQLAGAEWITLRHLSVAHGGRGVQVDSPSRNIDLEWLRLSGNGDGLYVNNAQNVRVRHLLSQSAAAGSGVFLTGTTTGFSIEQSVLWGHVFGINQNSSSSAALVTNSVIGVFGASPQSYAYRKHPSAILQADYNNVYLEDGARAGLVFGVGGTRDQISRSVSRWKRDFMVDTHSLSHAPGFVDPDSGDFSLQTNSVLIDAGNPAIDVSGSEPEPNGRRINIGLYGGTDEAQISPLDGWLTVVQLHDGGRAEGTNMLYWVATGSVTGDVVTLEYSADDGQAWTVITSSWPAATGTYSWDTTGFTNSILGRWRISSVSRPEISATNAIRFALRNAPLSFFVNDAYVPDEDLYTDAAGAAENTGASADSPLDSIQSVLNRYVVEADDVIYVDTGVYPDTAVELGFFETGTDGAPIVIQGSTNESAGGSVLQGSVGNPVLRLNASLHVALRHLTLQSAPAGQGIIIENDAADHLMEWVRIEGGAVGVDVSSAERIALRHVSVRNASGAGLLLGANAVDVTLDQSVLWMNRYGVQVAQTSARGDVRNSIIGVSGSGSFAYYLANSAAWAADPSTISLTANYNNFVLMNGATMAAIPVSPVAFRFQPYLSHWQDLTQQDLYSLAVDPLFVDADAGDFRIQSEAGRSAVGGGRTNDLVTSSLIDAGDPLSDASMESQGPVNIGQFGGSSLAADTPSTSRLRGRNFVDGGWAAGDIPLRWIATGDALTNTVTVSYSIDDGAQWNELTSGVAAADGEVVWPSGSVATPLAYWRVLLDDGSAGFTNPVAFAVRNAPLSFYVNDGFDPDHDRYTSASGSSANSGAFSNVPSDSVQAVVDRFALQPGDTIYIDTGDYFISQAIELAYFDRGSAGAPVTLQGSLNAEAGGSRFYQTVNGPIFRSTDDAAHVHYRNLQLFSAGSAGRGIVLEDGSDFALIDFVDVRGGVNGFDLSNVSDVRLQHISAREASNAGLYLGANADATVLAHGVLWSNRYGVQVAQTSSDVTIRHSILGVFGDGARTYLLPASAAWAQNPASIAIDADFNNYIVRDGATMALLPITTFPVRYPVFLSEWTRRTGNDQHSLSIDPLFVDADTGDFRLQSSAGYWSPDGTWPVSTNTSPLIDVGDPDGDGDVEGVDGGGRLNLGKYGGTPFASRSPTNASIVIVNLNDGGWIAGQSELLWVARGAAASGTVDIAYSDDQGLSWTVVETNVSAAAGRVAWDTLGAPSTPLGRWRVVGVPPLMAAATNHVDFAIRNEALTFYVNDALDTNDVYTSAAGTNTNTGASSDSPRSSIQSILDDYYLLGGDVILVDAGLYTLSASTEIGYFDQGVSGAPVTIRGAPGAYRSPTRVALANGPIFRVRDYARFVNIESMVLEPGGGASSVAALYEADAHNGQVSWVYVNGGYRGFSAQNVTNLQIRHTVVRDAADSGIHVGVNVRNLLVDQGVLWNNRIGVSLSQSTARANVRNTTIAALAAGSYAYFIDSPWLVADYNNLYLANGGFAALIDDGIRAGLDRRIPTVADWRDYASQDRHSLTVDPGVVDAAEGDFRLLSTSRLIDAGDPSASFSEEPEPNGRRVNIGQYGGTAAAQISPSGSGWFVPLSQSDGGQASNSIALAWVAVGSMTQEVVVVEYALDGTTNWQEIATLAASDSGSLDWASGTNRSALAQWRVRDLAGSVVTNSDYFALRNGPLSYWVNDDVSDLQDVYTTAPGDDGAFGILPSAPKRTVQDILDTYALYPGDRIYVDTGNYAENILFNDLILGEPGRPITIQGSTNKTLVGGSHIRRPATGGATLLLTDTQWLTFHDIVLSGGSAGIELDAAQHVSFSGVQLHDNETGLQVQSDSEASFFNGIIYSNSSQGVQNSGGDLAMKNVVVWDNPIGIDLVRGSTRVTNSVLQASGADQTIYRGTQASINGLTADYNNLVAEEGAHVALLTVNPPVFYRNTLDWQDFSGEDGNSMGRTPFFVDADAGVFVPQSITGRFDPATGGRVTDAVFSPLIDTGDPALLPGLEPGQNGDRVNLGAWGGTVHASESPTNAWLLTVNLNDGVALLDTNRAYSLVWTGNGLAETDRVSIVFEDQSKAPGSRETLLASNILWNVGSYTNFFISAVDSTTNGYWLVRSEGDTNVFSRSEKPMIVNNGPEIVISNPGLSVAPDSVEAGTTRHTLQRWRVDVDFGDAFLQELTVLLQGTFSTGDISRLQLRYSTSSLESGSALWSTLSDVPEASSYTFSGLERRLAIGSHYLFITADIATDAAGGQTLAALGPTASNLVFELGEAEGSIADGGIQQILQIPTVSTLAATDRTSDSATLRGEVAFNGGTNVLVRGFVFGATNTIEMGRGDGIYQTNLTNLAVNQQYSYSTFASNSVGLASGSATSLWTLARQPAQPEISNVGPTQFDVELGADGNPAYTEYQIRINGQYLLGDGALSATGIWQTADSWGQITVSNLDAGATYTVNARARNQAGEETAFGPSAQAGTGSKQEQVITFDELAPIWISAGPTTLTASASSGLPVSFASSNPGVATVSSNVVTLVGLGSTVITASQAGDAVYLAASNVQQTLVVFALPPQVVTLDASSLTVSNATLSGRVDGNGGLAVTERGVVWSLNGDLSSSNAVADVGSGTGVYAVVASGLAVDTRYYYAAYAVNATGTAYGVTSNFVTLAAVPGAVSVTNATLDSLELTLDVSGNPTSTVFAIAVDGSLYVQGDGSVASGEVWQTAADWGEPVTVTGLERATSYSFAVKARNQAGVETALGPATVGTTLAADPAAAQIIGLGVDSNRHVVVTWVSVGAGPYQLQYAEQAISNSYVWTDAPGSYLDVGAGVSTNRLLDIEYPDKGMRVYRVVLNPADGGTPEPLMIQRQVTLVDADTLRIGFSTPRSGEYQLQSASLFDGGSGGYTWVDEGAPFEQTEGGLYPVDVTLDAGAGLRVYRLIWVGPLDN